MANRETTQSVSPSLEESIALKHFDLIQDQIRYSIDRMRACIRDHWPEIAWAYDDKDELLTKVKKLEDALDEI